MEYISFDSHKRYTLALVEQVEGGHKKQKRIVHERGKIKEFLGSCKKGSPVAVETIGNWYWILDEIEEAEMVPRLVHAYKAKVMMGMINKTDKLDVMGLNRLQRVGTLPTVWIPPKEIRDKRELTRGRMVFSSQRTRIKNRIHATLAKYGINITEVSDLFGKKGKELLKEEIKQLPPQTTFTTKQLLKELEVVQGYISRIEKRMEKLFGETREIKLLKDTLPGVGFILSVVILLEVGDITRFPSPEHFASYAGTTPRVKSSGDKTRYGRLRPDVNRYLKWAFSEAASSIALNHTRKPERHVSKLYQRILKKKGHQKAIGAVARHLAEACYWMLKKGEVYQDPAFRTISSKKG